MAIVLSLKQMTAEEKKKTIDERRPTTELSSVRPLSSVCVCVNVNANDRIERFMRKREMKYRRRRKMNRKEDWQFSRTKKKRETKENRLNVIFSNVINTLTTQFSFNNFCQRTMAILFKVFFFYFILLFFFRSLSAFLVRSSALVSLSRLNWRETEKKRIEWEEKEEDRMQRQLTISVYKVITRWSWRLVRSFDEKEAKKIAST